MFLRLTTFALVAVTAASPVLVQRQAPAVTPAVLAPGQDTADPKAFLLYNADQANYPFTVHLPDRTTRNLPPFGGPLPLILSLTGSGRRGSADEAVKWYIRSYQAGTELVVKLPSTTAATILPRLAAEEFLTVTPIQPDDTAQNDATWDVAALATVLEQVLATFEVDPKRIYLQGYSMGARGGFNMLFAHPDLFAAAILFSGSTGATISEMKKLDGNSIRVYHGSLDRADLIQQTATAQYNWYTANGPSSIVDRTMNTIGPIPGADHGVMTWLPFEDEIDTDGYPGALPWLITQIKPEAGKCALTKVA